MKSQLTQREKAQLKTELEAIDQRLKNGEISQEEAERLKQEKADKRANNINDEANIFDNYQKLINRNKHEADSTYYLRSDFLSLDNNDNDDEGWNIDIFKTPKKDSARFKKTTSGIVLASGFLNIANAGGDFINNSPFKTWGSGFFDMGYQFRTKMVKSGYLRFNYGLDLRFNFLKPKDSRYFYTTNDQTELVDFTGNTAGKLKSNNFTFIDLTLPVYFEIGKVNRRGYANKFKFAVGGYVGLNLGVTQNYSYRTDDDDLINVHSKNDFQTNTLLYGVGAYIGYGNFTLFARYDLNDAFKKSNHFNGNLAAIGLRVTL